MKISGIYQIQSQIKPERIYIGSSIMINNRWRGHLKDLRNNKHHSKKLQRHYNKYGEVDLQFSVLLGCEKDDLLKTEQYFIDSYNPYFNLYKIARNCLGYKQSERVRLNRRVPQSEERKRINKESHKGQIPWMKGRSHTIESINKMKKSKQEMTQATKDKMSLSRKEYWKNKKLTA